MKDIPGYEGLYSVTEDGRVWSYPKYMYKGRFLKNSICCGYYTINLSKNLRHKAFRVHRLVAMTYLPNPENYPIVRHFDNNPQNNHISNLEWCTHQTNIQQSWSDGLSYTSEKQRETARKTGLASGKSVLQYTIDGVCINSFPSMSEAQRQTGVWFGNISKCIKGELKKAGGYRWKLGKEILN